MGDCSTSNSGLDVISVQEVDVMVHTAEVQMSIAQWCTTCTRGEEEVEENNGER